MVLFDELGPASGVTSVKNRLSEFVCVCAVCCRWLIGSWSWCPAYSTAVIPLPWLTPLTLQSGFYVHHMNSQLVNITLCLMICVCYGSVKLTLRHPVTCELLCVLRCIKNVVINVFMMSAVLCRI